MSKENLLDETLISKFIAGEATPEEAILVNDWIAASEENKIYFTQLEQAWTFDKKSSGSSLKKEMIWSALEQTINKTQGSKKELSISPYRIAAAILLLIGFSAAFYFFNSSKQSPSTIVWETRQTSNEVAELNLPDGSAVKINRKSVIKWQRKFDGRDREILLEGEAYFDVAHDPGKPFVVSTQEVKIKVLGTAFNILDNKEQKEIETIVTRGKVLMYTRDRQIVIEAGMKGTYHKQTKELTLTKMKNSNSIAYATHSLSFSESTLKDVTDQLSRAYGVQFIFENKKIQDCRLTTECQNKSLAFIMDVISESLNLTYTIKNNTVYISGDGCI
ncbi:MAG TPA: FecR family protein [Cyclobacteriaceae bacterium]|jgi:ferric-dicitrate binding protein FerR (iron transport regulator)|nr:FecR family protein [Cyclobacteriaceae bacterium]